MTAVLAQRPPLSSLIAEIHEDGLTTRQIAEAAYAAADEESNREAALRGWADEVLRWEAARWSRPDSVAETAARSGHNNRSGRYSQSASRPDAGLFGLFVRTNDGASYKLGDLTADLCRTLRAEYGQRKSRNAAGEKFFAELEKALAKDGKETVAQLGAERVEAMRRKAGYRE